MCHKTMITVLVPEFNMVSQDFYDKVINTLPVKDLTCSCGCTGGLIRYGHYHRSVKTSLCDSDRTSLNVQRLLCTECLHTHAVLLYLIVPYSQITLKDMVDIIQCAENAASFQYILERTPSIDDDNARYIIRQYFHHWQMRLSITVWAVSIHHLVRCCFQSFSQQFMQNHAMQNILFSFTPT